MPTKGGLGERGRRRAQGGGRGLLDHRARASQRRRRWRWRRPRLRKGHWRRHACVGARPVRLKCLTLAGRAPSS